jgi:Aegerolysin
MPARTFRVLIKNTTEDTRLHLRDAHLCGGEWTSSDWNPPQDIQPGELKGFQSESDGFMTGTEGWAKYETVDASNNGFGMVYVYWDNPYYGRTYFGLDKDFNDVKADCDVDDSSGGGSTFGAPNPQKPDNFDLLFSSLGYTESGTSSRTLTADELANMGLTPWTWPGLVGILKDPVLTTNFVVRAAPPPPQFGDLGKQTLAPLTDAVAANWTGEWSSDSVNIQITQTAWDMLQISVSDKTANPTLEFTETFAIGDRSRIIQSALDSVSALTGQGTNDTLARALKLTVSDALRGVSPTQSRGATTPRIIRALISATDTLSTILTTKGMSKVARTIADAHVKSRWQVWLSHGVGLELYWIIQGGGRVGERIHYQRVVGAGIVAADTMLNFVPAIA